MFVGDFAGQLRRLDDEDVERRHRVGPHRIFYLKSRQLN